MKIKVNKSGFVTRVRYERNESGSVVPYQRRYGILCANLHTVVWALEDVDVNTPALETPVSGEAVIELWERVSAEWYSEKFEKHLLEHTGLFFKYDKQDYMLLAIPSTKMFVAVAAEFIQPFLATKAYNFYLHITEDLPSEEEDNALDLTEELDLPLILAVRSDLGDLTAFTAPALIPEEIMSYLR